MKSNIPLDVCVDKANTGLDAIKRAPIVEHDTGIRCLRIQDVSQGKDFENWGFAEVTDANFKKFQLKKDDILIARTGGSIGVNRFIAEDLQAVYNNGLIRIRVDIEKYYPKFVFYLLRTDSFKQHINAIAFSTAAQPNMKIKDFLRFEFLDLPLNVQIQIADQLSNIDDKIELNRQTNQTLEQIAQALFKCWFVDFEPTRAKIIVKEKGANIATQELAAQSIICGAITLKQLEAITQNLEPTLQQAINEKLNQANQTPINAEQLKTIAALFPNALVDSELGDIPEGWEVSAVGEHVNVTKGRSYKSSELEPSNTALVTLKSFMRGGGYREDGLKAYSGIYKTEQVIMPGDLVMSLTDVTQAAEIIGKPAIVTKNDAFEILVASLDVAILRSKIPELKEYFYGLMSTYRFHRYAESFATGTTVLHLNHKGITSFEYPKPSLELSKIYSETAKPMLAMHEGNIHVSRSLAALRDTLLPKLLSGELNVSND